MTTGRTMMIIHALAIVARWQWRALVDRACVRLMCLGLAHCSNRCAWRHYRIERAFWLSAEGVRLIGRLERGGGGGR